MSDTNKNSDLRQRLLLNRHSSKDLDDDGLLKGAQSTDSFYSASGQQVAEGRREGAGDDDSFSDDYVSDFEDEYGADSDWRIEREELLQKFRTLLPIVFKLAGAYLASRFLTKHSASIISYAGGILSWISWGSK